MGEVKRFLIFIVVFRLVVFLFKSWVQGGKCLSKARLDGKVVVVTGATSGIGKETAKEMVKRGAEVHICCRDPVKSEDVKREIKEETGREVFFHKLDLTSLDSVRECVKDLNKCVNKIDVLINNAGVSACPPMETAEGFELQFGVNHVAHFLLTTQLLPLLRKAGKSRVVVVSSKAHEYSKMDFDDLNWKKREYNAFEAYGQSKLANVLFAKELARRETEEKSGVTVYSLHPGTVNTDIIRYVEATSNRIRLAMIKLVFNFFSKTPKNGAQTTIYCAVDESLEGVTGKYYQDCKEIKASKAAENVDDAKRLWTLTEDMVNKKD